MQPAQRTQGLGHLVIQETSAACRRRQAFGQETFDLSVGQPDFATPTHICEAMQRAVAEGQHRYAPLHGVGELRVAIRRRLAEEGLRYKPREIVVTAGATGGLWCAFQSLLEPGDGVLIPVPSYPLYAAQVQLSGGVAVPIHTSAAEGFRLTPESLREAARSGARLLVLNSPCNPTGAVYSRQELEALGEVVLENGLTVICDEVYRDYVFRPPAFTSFAALGRELQARSVVIRSFSKTYSMTGWRVGYAAAPAALIQAMIEVQHASMMSPATPCQHAAAAALEDDEDLRANLIETYGHRARKVSDRMRRIPGVRLPETRGSFFAFPDLGDLCADVDAFCRRLLKDSGVALVPGSAFGAPSCARLSFAVSDQTLEKGLDRLEQALREGAAGYGFAA